MTRASSKGQYSTVRIHSNSQIQLPFVLRRLRVRRCVAARGLALEARGAVPRRPRGGRVGARVCGRGLGGRVLSFGAPPQRTPSWFASYTHIDVRH